MEVVEINNNKKEKKMGTGTETGSGTEDRERALETEKDESPENEKKEQGQYRVVIDKASSMKLDEMLIQVQNGFESGDITKSDIASWIINAAAESFGDQEVKIIRNLYFDERKILAVLLKNSKNENLLPENLKKAIREIAGLNEAPKKKLSKDNYPSPLPPKLERPVG